MSTTRTTPKRARNSLIAVSNGCAANWPIWPPLLAGAGPSAAWKTVIRRGTHSDSGPARAVVVREESRPGGQSFLHTLVPAIAGDRPMIDVCAGRRSKGPGQRALTQDGVSIRDNSTVHILRDGSGAV